MSPLNNKALEQGRKRLISAIGAVEAIEQHAGLPPPPKKLQEVRGTLRKEISGLLMQAGTAVDNTRKQKKPDAAITGMFEVLTQISDSVVEWSRVDQPFNPGILGQYRQRLEQICISPT